MNYQYLTADMRLAAMTERHHQIEVAHFQASVQLGILQAAGAADTDENVIALSQRLSDLEAESTAFGTVCEAFEAGSAVCQPVTEQANPADVPA